MIKDLSQDQIDFHKNLDKLKKCADRWGNKIQPLKMSGDEIQSIKTTT